MKKLEERIKIKRTGIKDLYANQIVRTETKAMYLRDDGYYEVFNVKLAYPYPRFTNDLEKYEHYPTNEEFGKIAWIFKSEEKAFEKYNFLK